MRSFIPAIFIIAVVFIFSCTKIDSTVLGGDLIPAVDNVNTFDTIIDVETINLLQNDDSTYLTSSDLLAVGSTRDQLFGQSNATLYFEFKPANLSAASAGSFAKPFKDSLISLDSTVLSLRYSASYGDTMSEVTFDVFVLTEKFKDTARYSIKDVPPAASLLTPVGSKTVSLRSLMNDSVKIYRSSTLSYKTVRQLRISIDSFQVNWREILSDSAKLSSDADFRSKFKGFAVKMRTTGVPSPNSMAYFNITDTASRLEFYYKRKNGKADTVSTSFSFNPNNSGFADNVIWTRNGAEINQHLSTLQPDQLVYIKTTPGTAGRIRIPGLSNLSNRIIHRAELKMYQVQPVNPSDSVLAVPPLLYLERFQPGNIAFNKYQSIPIDLSPNTAYGDCFPTTTGIDYGYFGGFPKVELVPGTTTTAKAYTFNISRYVQQIITKKLVNADLRLSANLFSQYDGCGTSSAPLRVTTNPISYGQVKLVGGAPSNTNSPYKMRLRIIYSKL